MNALARTGSLIIEALSPKPVATVADFFAWEARQTPRPYQNIRFAVGTQSLRINDESPLSELRRMLANRRDALKSKAERNHFTYDLNEHFAVNAMLALIDRFNVEQR